jgi:glycosyltransferase involved in cell wall biosynthesis
MRASLSAVFITRDAAGVLGPALESVAFADEIVVVDSGSTDGTRALADAHGARVIDQAWLGFGRQKQFAVEAARHDWVLCLDADERVSPALRAAIEAALVAPTARVYAMPRCNRFMGRWLRHGEGYPDWSVRLFHREFARWSDDAVHERVLAETPAARLAGDLMHESAETLASYLAKQDRYTSLQARALADDSVVVNVLRMVLSPVVRFVRFYFLRAGFLDGIPGLVHIAIGCRNSFAKYAKAVRLAASRH